MSDTPKQKREPLQRAPTLYVIIAYKILKGLLFAVLALTVYNLSDNNLPSDYQNLLHTLGFNADRKFWTELAARVDNITEPQMVHVAIAMVIYSLFSLVEGTGMMFRAGWAGWLAIGEAAFFIPIEVHHLIGKFSWPVLVISLLNVFIVWYLFQNRAWLFRHHHPRKH
jgi:uncharacterized membrane protein (DUF2068 family)